MKKMRIYYIVRLSLFLAIAVLIGVYAQHLLEYLPFLVGGVIVLYGFEAMFLPVTRLKLFFFREYQFYLGLVEVLLGSVMMAVVRDFNSICMIWGTWTIVRESFEIYETGVKILKKFPAFLSLSLSIIEIVFSVLLIVFASEHHALTHIYLLVPEFVIYGISPLLFELYREYQMKKLESK